MKKEKVFKKKLLISCTKCGNEFNGSFIGLYLQSFECPYCKTNFKISPVVIYEKEVISCPNEENKCFRCKHYKEHECNWEYGDAYGYCSAGSDGEKVKGMICDIDKFESKHKL